MAYNFYDFAGPITDFFTNMDSSTKVLGAIFLICFGILFVLFKKPFINSPATGNVLAFAFSFLIVYILNKTDIAYGYAFDYLGYDTGIASDIIGIILIVGGIIALFIVGLDKVLMIAGTLSLLTGIIAIYTDIVYQKSFFIILGITLFVIGFFLWRRKVKREANWIKEKAIAAKEWAKQKYEQEKIDREKEKKAWENIKRRKAEEEAKAEAQRKIEDEAIRKKKSKDEKERIAWEKKLKREANWIKEKAIAAKEWAKQKYEQEKIDREKEKKAWENIKRRKAEEEAKAEAQRKIEDEAIRKKKSKDEKERIAWEKKLKREKELNKEIEKLQKEIRETIIEITKLEKENNGKPTLRSIRLRKYEKELTKKLENLE